MYLIMTNIQIQHYRDKYGKTKKKNCMHSSDSLKKKKKEGRIIFN